MAVSGSMAWACSASTAAALAYSVAASTPGGRPMLSRMARMVAAKLDASAEVATRLVARISDAPSAQTTRTGHCRPGDTHARRSGASARCRGRSGCFADRGWRVVGRFGWLPRRPFLASSEWCTSPSCRTGRRWCRARSRASGTKLARVPRDPPANDAPGHGVDHERHLYEVRPGRDAGDVADSRDVRPRCPELAVDVVRRTGCCRIGNRGADLPAPNHALRSHRPYQARNRAAGHHQVPRPHRSVTDGRAIGSTLQVGSTPCACQ